MQKIALQRASSNSDVPDVPTGLYLSAGRLPLPAHAADRSVVASSHTHALGDGKTVSTAHPLTYQAPRGVGNVTNADEVDDFLCWTIVGIGTPAQRALIQHHAVHTRSHSLSLISPIQPNTSTHFSMLPLFMRH